MAGGPLPLTYVQHPKLEKPYGLPAFYVTQESFDDMLSYQPESGDIFVTTYPKCGTTWVMYVMNLMRNGGEPKEGQYLTSGPRVPSAIPCLEFGRKSMVENLTDKPRIMKTHLYPDLMPWSKEAKYIFIARNPKDCFNSYFYHTVALERIFNTPLSTFDQHFEIVINGAGEFGDYFKSVPEWREKSKTESNILFVLYEDIKENPKREFLKIFDFVGEEWGQKARANGNELLTKIVNASEIEKMMERKDTISDIGHTPYLRKGVVGDWKTNFNEDQSRRVDEKMKKVSETFPGFDKLWEKYQDILKF